MRALALFAAFVLGGSTGCAALASRSPRGQQYRYFRSFEPAPIAGVGVDSPVRRRLRVRVAFTDARARSPGWRQRFEASLEAANQALAAAAGLELNVVGYVPWPSRAGSRDTVAAHLEALASFDDGSDVDLVIGLTDPVTFFSQGYDELGAAYIGGRHIVLRGMAGLVERTQFREAFDLVDADDAHALLERRRSFREVAVLLHEVAHTAGAQHVEERHTLMASAIEYRADRFPEPTLVHLRQLAEGPEPRAAETRTREGPEARAAGSSERGGPEAIAVPEARAAGSAVGPRTQARAVGEAFPGSALGSKLEFGWPSVDPEALVDALRFEEAEAALEGRSDPFACALRSRMAQARARLGGEDLPPEQRPAARLAVKRAIAPGLAPSERSERVAAVTTSYEASSAALVATCFRDFERRAGAKACAEALELDPDLSVPNLLLGLALRGRQTERALALLSRAVRIDPELKLGWRILSGMLGDAPEGRAKLKALRAQSERCSE